MIATGANDKLVRAGTHRTRPIEETLDRLRPLMPALGITRVADVTGLDRIGIPVMMSVRPNSRGLSVQQGKGLSREAALASAVMESVESFAAEQDSVAVRHLASAAPAVLLPRHALLTGLAPGDLVACIEGHDLFTGAVAWVPQDLVRFDASLPSAPALFRSGTNGLATGNTHDEALLHAVCELVERDAEALWLPAPREHRDRSRIDPRTIDDPTVHGLLDRFAAADLPVEVWDMTSDIDIPVFGCEIDDRHGSGHYLGPSGGAGCHPSAAVALCRALSEAAQTRLTGISGSRDDIEPERYLLSDWDRTMARLLFDDARDVSGRAPPRARSFDGPTVRGDLRAVLDRLHRARVSEIACVDLTEQAFGIPCVRAVSSQLEGPYRKGVYAAGPRAREKQREWA